jgi:hypothetical protein
MLRLERIDRGFGAVHDVDLALSVDENGEGTGTIVSGMRCRIEDFTRVLKKPAHEGLIGAGGRTSKKI